MFNIFKKIKKGQTVSFQIDGMHCTSCSMNIDGELEATPGVISAETSYAKGRAVVNFDQTQVSVEKLKNVIESLDYSVTLNTQDAS